MEATQLCATATRDLLHPVPGCLECLTACDSHCLCASLPHRRVLGIDATAAKTLGALALVLRRIGVELVISRTKTHALQPYVMCTCLQARAGH